MYRHLAKSSPALAAKVVDAGALVRRDLLSRRIEPARKNVYIDRELGVGVVSAPNAEFVTIVMTKDADSRMRQRTISRNPLPKGSRDGETAANMIGYNVRYRDITRTGKPPDAVARVRLPEGRPKPLSQAPRHLPVALAISALAHLLAAYVLLVWLQRTVPAPLAIEQTVEMLFE